MGGRTTQETVEVLFTVNPGTVRASQETVETLQTPTDQIARTSQVAVEALQAVTNDALVTQVMLEVLIEGAIYDEVASGGARAGGYFATIYDINITSAGVRCGGSAIESYIDGGTTYNETASGGVVCGGRALVPYIQIGSGGVVCGGSATNNVTQAGNVYSETMLGGVVCGGTLFLFVVDHPQGVVCGGSAVDAFVTQQVGGVVLGGRAVAGNTVQASRQGVKLGGTVHIQSISAHCTILCGKQSDLACVNLRKFQGQGSKFVTFKKRKDVTAYCAFSSEETPNPQCSGTTAILPSITLCRQKVVLVDSTKEAMVGDDKTPPRKFLHAL